MFVHLIKNPGTDHADSKYITVCFKLYYEGEKQKDMDTIQTSRTGIHTYTDYQPSGKTIPNGIVDAPPLIIQSESDPNIQK